jgi:hydrogenase expression/formation protein HypC
LRCIGRSRRGRSRRLRRCEMCLAVPGQVLEIDETVEPRMGTVSFGGIRKRICLAWVPEAKIGEYVIVHVGFAISRLNEEEAMKTLTLLEQAGEG